eukprot:scaffold1800_cov387-Prasinococcus_capsulatus_cf.AAC.5
MLLSTGPYRLVGRVPVHHRAMFTPTKTGRNARREIVALAAWLQARAPPPATARRSLPPGPCRALRYVHVLVVGGAEEQAGCPRARPMRFLLLLDAVVGWPLLANTLRGTGFYYYSTPSLPAAAHPQARRRARASWRASTARRGFRRPPARESRAASGAAARARGRRDCPGSGRPCC